MTSSARPHPLPAPPVLDRWVLPEMVTTEATGRGPWFDDDVWDFTPFIPRTNNRGRLRFTRLSNAAVALGAKEYVYSRITRVIPTRRRPFESGQPLKLTSVGADFDRYVLIIEALAERGVSCLEDATQEDLNALLRTWMSTVDASTLNRTQKGAGRRKEVLVPRTVATRIATLQHMGAHRRHIFADKLSFDPWPGRPAFHVVKHVSDEEENSTPRIPEPILAAVLKAALFYVSTASADILAARKELEDLTATTQGRRRLGKGKPAILLNAFVDRRRAEGRGIPALPGCFHFRAPHAPVVDGVVQAPNFLQSFAMAGTSQAWHHKKILLDAGAELGYEEGGFDTPMSPWPDTGRPWRSRLNQPLLEQEITMLRVACWLVIAYLSGMRDVEVRELARDCARTEEGQDGRTRFKNHGRVFKGRQLTGDEADWVVLEVVHDAVRVLQQLNDDPTHLFGYRSQLGHYTLLHDVPSLLDKFRDHINELFSTEDGPFVPLDGEQAWKFTTRQFRRTLAWHIAHQPFGVVAGARQYKHAKITMFEGYAGTSESGFAAEVTAEEAVAMLDYVEDLYRSWDDDQPSTGGAAGRINAEFERIRRELGDLSGAVADERRLRTMLSHLAKTLHPGVLNDCFFQAATAVCVKRAKIVGRPVPQHNMCLKCPNARRSTVHLPRLITARDQALELHDKCNAAGPVPKNQELAITEHITQLDDLIQDLQTIPEPQQ
ncbi:hypothetical protein [Streptomyces sp. Isolate_219]|uniref:hypothetical protein n=1 Tax=Streptomyces sp. Isolate_219 TaxID=2950110 RepID=UPI0021C7EBDE|nr:hypothetical protein [Streptomyces sp. Isolate_219]MCR8574284.1 hypothetical protein [Streptomyces sp. Isolate_219]